MITPEYLRWQAYCQRYREPARTKMLQLFSHIAGREHASAASLAAAIQGNANDRVRISQAIQDGEIVRVDGRLRLPSSRTEDGISESDRLYARASDAVWDWVRSLPVEGLVGERARQITILIDSFFDEDIDYGEPAIHDEEEREQDT